MSDETKRCTKCCEWKPLTDFYGDRSTPDKHTTRCKACYKANRIAWHKRNPERFRENQRRLNQTKGFQYRLKYNFGLTPEQYAEIAKEQNGVCAICGRPETTIDPRYGKTRQLAVDHDHATGKIRGLLCRFCNTALGLLDDDSERMEKAAAYVRKHSESEENAA